MADYRIICANTEHPHRHISDVGTAPYLDLTPRMWTVQEVLDAMDAGDTFHTIGATSARRAGVHRDTCRINGCSVKTLRSAADAIEDNNLDNLGTCSITG